MDNKEYVKLSATIIIKSDELFKLPDSPENSDNNSTEKDKQNGG